ncbi:MAG: hypothetical protein KKD44_09980 [Proteobacteria bacterium]|nr:hypothetical protein [Pseudomonadota bacterium]
MMENNENQNFIFGSDDSDTYNESTQNQRFDKLNQKITLLSILIPSILGIIFVFMYLDMKNKVVQVHNTGSSEVQKTADDLNKEIQDLQTASAEFEKRLDGKLAALEKSLAPITAKISKMGKDIDYLSSIKIDKKALDSEIQKVTTTHESLKKDLANLGDQHTKLVTIAQELQTRTKDIPAISAAQDALKNSIESLKNDMADKNELATALKKQKVFYQLEIQELSDKVEKKLSNLKAAQTKAATPRVAAPPAQE